jgi:hypothetical protein
VVTASVLFGESVFGSATAERLPCLVAVIDPPPALTSNSETTHSAEPPVPVSVTPAVARMALVP